MYDAQKMGLKLHTDILAEPFILSLFFFTTSTLTLDVKIAIDSQKLCSIKYRRLRE